MQTVGSFLEARLWAVWCGALWCASIWGLGACGEEAPEDPGALRLELPPGFDFSSAIVVVEGTEGASGQPLLEVHARAIEPDGSMEPVLSSVDVSVAYEVRLLGYPVDLVDLSVLPGKLSPAGAGVAQRPLPDPVAIHRRTHADPAWSATSVTPDALPNFPIPAVERCSQWMAQVLDLGLSSRHRAHFAVAAPGQGFVVSAWNGENLNTAGSQRVFHIDQERFVSIEAAQMAGQAAPLMFSAFADPDGPLWIGDENGGTWRGLLNPAGCGSEVLPCATLELVDLARLLSLKDELIHLVGPQKGPTEALFGLADNGSLERFDPTDGWAAIDSLSGGRVINQAGIAYVNSREVVSVWDQRDTVLRWKDGERTLEPISGLEGSGLTAVAHGAALGTVVGDTVGGLHLGRSRGWRTLRARSSSGAPIHALAPFRSGFLALDAAGMMEEFVPARELCPRVEPGMSVTSGDHRLVVIGDDVYAIIVRGSRGPQVLWYRRI